MATRGLRLETFESRLLVGNPLGDPSRREVAVYLPPSGRSEGRPLLVYLPGYLGAGWGEAERPRYLSENLFGLVDRLVRTGGCPEAVVVAPDCLTTLGGSQYVNSTATGPYADYLVNEIVPWAKEKYRTGPIGIFGQSSGGFGAVHLALEYPGTFEAVGSSAGDVAFDLTIPPEIPRAVRAFRRSGGPEKFLSQLFATPSLLKGPLDPSGSALLMVGLAACYSPRPDGSGEFDLPFDPATGEIDPGLWARWLSFDPLVRLARAPAVDALRRLRRIHLTASSDDEWYLNLGAARFATRLREAGLPAVYDELPGGHFDKLPRFEVLIPSLVRCLTPG